MSADQRSLLDHVTVQHGPQKLLAHYFLKAYRQVRDQGIELRWCDDFARLCEVRRRNATNPMMAAAPQFDPVYSDIAPGSFWLEGVDPSGNTMLTHAVRLFDWPSTTLKREFDTMRMHYRNPAPYIAAGESANITAPAATRITGCTILGGAMWVRPDYRRRGLTRIVPRISRTLAYTRRNSAYTWGFMDFDLHAGGASRAYGRYTVEPGVSVNLACWGPSDSLLLWMDQETLLAEIEEAVAQGSSDLSRKIDMPSTKSSAPRRQGNNTRL